MTTLREAMNAHPAAAGARDTVSEAARQMRDLALESLPVCDDDGRLTAVLTERDIVVRSVAAGDDPTTTLVVSLTHGPGPVVSIAADSSLEEALGCMIEHALRRLPVTQHGRLVGTVTQAQLAALVPPETVRRLVASAWIG